MLHYRKKSTKKRENKKEIENVLIAITDRDLQKEITKKNLTKNVIKAKFMLRKNFDI